MQISLIKVSLPVLNTDSKSKTNDTVVYITSRKLVDIGNKRRLFTAKTQKMPVINDSIGNILPIL